MASHGWVEYGLAVAMVATAAYCASCVLLPRLRAASGHRDADLTHAAMAVVMAAMLAGVARPLWSGPLVIAFALPALWFAARAIGARRQAASGWRADRASALSHVQLSVGGVAMIYMSGVAPGFGSESTTPVSSSATVAEAPHHMGHAMVGSLGSTGSAGIDFALAGALIFGALTAFAFIAIGQLAASAEPASSQVRRTLWRHRLTLCCQLAMAAAMAHMVATMV